MKKDKGPFPLEHKVKTCNNCTFDAKMSGSTLSVKEWHTEVQTTFITHGLKKAVLCLPQSAAAVPSGTSVPLGSGNIGLSENHELSDGSEAVEQLRLQTRLHD